MGTGGLVGASGLVGLVGASGLVGAGWAGEGLVWAGVLIAVL